MNSRFKKFKIRGKFAAPHCTEVIFWNVPVLTLAVAISQGNCRLLACNGRKIPLVVINSHNHSRPSSLKVDALIVTRLNAVLLNTAQFSRSAVVRFRINAIWTSAVIRDLKVVKNHRLSENACVRIYV